MTFKQYLIEQENQVYPVADLTEYRVWFVRKSNMLMWYRFIKKKGWYKKGARLLLPVVKPENEVEKRAEELVDKFADNLIAIVRGLREWAQNNTTPERLKELGYGTVNIVSSPYNMYALPLSDAKRISEKFFQGLFVIPRNVFNNESSKFEKDGLDFLKANNMMTSVFDFPFTLHNEVKPVTFETENRERGINEYKEYKEYNIDTETEEAFGDILTNL